MTGGQVVAVPESISRPPRIPVLMWPALQREHNGSQLFAILTVSAPPADSQDTQIFLVQGPPGTGKTKCIVGITSVLLLEDADRTHAGGSNKLLVCAPSNAAVDELLSRVKCGGELLIKSSWALQN